MPPRTAEDQIRALTESARRRLDDMAAQIRRLEAQVAQGAGGASGQGLGLSAIPGSVWSLFSKLAWADPDMVRAHTLVLETTIQGTDDGAGTPTDGVATEADSEVISRSFFMVRTMDGWVERDPNNPTENESANYVSLQIEDHSRNYPLFRESLRMIGMAGTATRPGVPVLFDEYPLAFLPGSRVVATFTPLAGFPVAACSATQETTRRVGLHLHGVMVDERIVDQLIRENKAILNKGRLLPKL